MLQLNLSSFTLTLWKIGTQMTLQLNPKKVVIRLMPEELAQNPKDVFLFNAALERQGGRNPRDITIS